MDEEVIKASMEIILNAGDAREENIAALTCTAEGDITGASKHIKQAEDMISIAHRTQTDRIQEETSGEISSYSLLFAHAQDTLMTINSEIILTKNLMKVFASYEKRLIELEKITRCTTAVPDHAS